MQKKVLSVSESKDNNSITIKHLGKRRYSSKVEYYKQCCANTDRAPPRKKYKKINPNIRFNLINLNSIDLTEDRYKPDIDITICYNAKQKNNLHNIILKEGGHMLVSAKKYNLGKNVALKDLTSLPYIEITNLLSIYEKSNIMNYLIDSGIKMNFYLKTDSYSSALSIINEGIGIGIIDDNTIENAKLDVVNISNIKDGSFKYRINATMKKGNIREECNQFFNYLAQ